MNMHSALVTISRKSRHFVRVLEGIIFKEINLDGAFRLEFAIVSRIRADIVGLQRETLQDTASSTISVISVNNNGVSIVLDKIEAIVDVETRGSCATLSSVIKNRVPRIRFKEFRVPIVSSWRISIIAARSSVCL